VVDFIPEGPKWRTFSWSARITGKFFLIQKDLLANKQKQYKKYDDRKMVTASADETICVWDMKKETYLYTLCKKRKVFSLLNVLLMKK